MDDFGFEPDYTNKISLFAMENVGKETLSKNHFLNRVFDHGSMITLGVDFATKDLELYGKSIRSSILLYASDFRERFNEKFRYYINGSNGVILMYDISNAKSLDWLSEWCQLIKNNLDYDPPILLVGNKLDLEENREVSKEEVEKFKEKYDISSSIEISLKTGENVEKMFMDIVRMILKRLHLE